MRIVPVMTWITASSPPSVGHGRHSRHKETTTVTTNKRRPPPTPRSSTVWLLLPCFHCLLYFRVLSTGCLALLLLVVVLSVPFAIARRISQVLRCSYFATARRRSTSSGFKSACRRCPRLCLRPCLAGTLRPVRVGDALILVLVEVAAAVFPTRAFATILNK